MSKILKIGIINVVLISLIIYFFNFMLFFLENRYSMFEGFKKTFKTYQSFMQRDISDKATYYKLIEDKDEYRRVENRLSKKNPIILFGCSFTYGSDLEYNETLSYMLGKLTGRPVYNRAKGGWGVQHMYYQLKNENFYKIFSLNSNFQLTSAPPPKKKLPTHTSPYTNLRPLLITRMLITSYTLLYIVIIPEYILPYL